MTVWLTPIAAFWLILNAGLATAQDQPPGSIRGTVTDPSASIVAGAVVTLETPAGQRTTITDAAGVYHFSPVDPGTYTLTISASGFGVWKTTNVVVGLGEPQALPPAVLQVATAATKVDVGLPRHELAAEQIKAEEKQRLVGVFPHYFVTYDPNAAPLTAAQKFQLGWKSFFDVVPVVSAAIGAGIEQARNSYHEFGQGMEGYGKRFGAGYADQVNAILIGNVLMQSVFHQDPRYFYKGVGRARSRALYAFATAFVVKGDNGHWQPAYADVLGGLAAGEISTLYYPASSRTGLRLFHNVLEGFAGRAAGNLFEEFLLRKVTTHVPQIAALSRPMLREGTPVSLISVGDLSAKNTGRMNFTLASDLQAEGTIVAKAGSTAWGEATYVNGPEEAPHVALARVRLTVGKVNVPLRSTQVRGASGELQYHRLEDSGRIVVELYVAQDVPLTAAQ